MRADVLTFTIRRRSRPSSEGPALLPARERGELHARLDAVARRHVGAHPLATATDIQTIQTLLGHGRVAYLAATPSCQDDQRGSVGLDAGRRRARALIGNGGPSTGG
ncbi:hypothetical protein BE11_03835 [Sorangium cellulosum]|nr:hypothetical protein BE11_03835 [Sorangium cellulosum]